MMYHRSETISDGISPMTSPNRGYGNLLILSSRRFHGGIPNRSIHAASSLRASSALVTRNQITSMRPFPNTLFARQLMRQFVC